MNDEELIDALHFLGIDERNARVVMLLPLVQVAWADGTVQPAERVAIESFADQHGWLPEEADYVLRGWLEHAPTEAYHDRGREVIRELARRDGAFDSAVTPDSVETLVALCEKVAKATGGLFGFAFSVSTEERAAIESIAESLRIARSEGFGDLLAGLDEQA